MNQIDRNKLIKLIVTLALIFLFVGIANHIHKKNSVTLDQYAKQHPELNHTEENGAGSESGPSSVSEPEPTSEPTTEPEPELTSEPDPEQAVPECYVAKITGGYLNGGADGTKMLAERVTYHPDGSDANAPDAEPSDVATPGAGPSGSAAEAFYYEPLSETLESYITGVSFPAPGADTAIDLAIGYSDLRYLHVLHYNFDGEITEGELICNKAIADDLLDIFYTLYLNEYQLEKVLLIDEYGGDDTASMEDNNTSCFNYRVVDGTTNLSKHALGLALDINPFYNPYVTYEKDGSLRISPADSAVYADRSQPFPYKIDKEDLCYKLFIDHGFIWGGNWNSLKDYQHFQKTK